MYHRAPSLSTPIATSRREQRRRRISLVALLLDLFTPAELRRAVLDHQDGADVLGEVPEPGTPNDLVALVVAAFDRRGVDGELFEILLERRPRRRQKIEEVALMWGIEVRSP